MRLSNGLQPTNPSPQCAAVRRAAKLWISVNRKTLRKAVFAAHAVQLGGKGDLGRGQLPRHQRNDRNVQEDRAGVVHILPP